MLKELTTRIQSDITLSQAMGVEVLSLDSSHVKLFAPLAQNKNHQGTAFGGSINALATLACWSVVTLTAEELKVKMDYTVIQDSSIKYLKPITGDFTAEARWASDRERTEFLETLRKKGLARAKLTAPVLIHGSNEVCAILTGRFVVRTATTQS